MTVPAIPTMADLVQSMAADNPELAQVLQVLAAREQAAAAEDDLDLGLGLVAAAEPPRPTCVDPALVRALLDEADELRRRNDELADALGACARCWGRDLACGACGGHGGPGARRQVPVLFDAWVAPAVRRVAAARQRPPHPVRVEHAPSTSLIETEGA
jgi:hypothetical protein